MKNSVYVETTVISYLTAKPSRDLIVAAHQAATEQWWRERRSDFELFISELVTMEAQEGDADASRLRIGAIRGIPMLPLSEEAVILAKRLVEAHALPTQAEDDALHVALAAVNEIDILLTWNCRHIANMIAMPKIRATIQQAGYSSPTITTPGDLLESLGDV